MSRVIDEENDPDVLRAYLNFVIGQNNQLIKENERLRTEREQKAQQQLASDDQLLALRKRMFGKSSEKRPSGRQRDREDRQLLLHSKRLAPPPSERELKKFLEIKCDHELSPMALAEIAKEYGYPEDSEWECIEGFVDESTEVDYVAPKVQKKRHRRFKYRLKVTKGTGKEIIVTAPGPLKLMPGSSYSIDFGVEIASGKYIYHLPLERQRQQLSSLGLNVSPKTLYSQCFFISCYLEELAERIKAEVLSHGLAVHADETPWPINNKKQDDGYMWILSNQAGSYYYFAPTRSGDIAKELVGSYQGPVLTDGFSGYNKVDDLEGIVLAHCWSHVRRKFTDIEENYPTEVNEILNLLEKLFKIERESTTFEDLAANRTEKSDPLIEEIEKWLMATKTKARAESGLIKAINYAMNHWKGLTLFLEDTRIPLTNNDAERSVRHSVMGRKNFHGSRTVNGADVAATLYTVVESCKKAELDPKEFIRMAVIAAIEGKLPPTPMQHALQTRAH